jgi:uncharacterized membrane protein
VSLESGRKLCFVASLLAVVMPIVAVAGLASLIFSAIAMATRGVIPSFGSGVAFTVGLVAFAVALVVIAVLEFILFVVGMHRLSGYFKEPAIFKNLLYAILVGVVSTVVVSVLMSLQFVFSLSSYTPVYGSPVAPQTGMYFVGSIAVLALSVAMGIVSAVFIYRSFSKLGEASGVESFKTAGLLYLIGAFIPFVAWIGWIFAAIGYHNLKPTTPTTYQTQTSTPTIQTKRCPYCSTENKTESLYCRSCGKPLQ